ncbi:MAG: hypothetical protein KGN36_16470 [Acidobacteriota bacterium]|nr:hypothetical protein [Acidobacteriota bacterium]
MSPTAAVIGQLASARLQLESACDLLLSPSAATLDRCAALMASAGETMAGLSPALARARGDASALEEAWRLRRTFQRASSLLGHAALFHQNWTAIRGAMTGGYTPDGEPAPVRHPGRLSLVA